MKVVLKEGREKSLHQRHPWIFSGAIASFPECLPGELFPVYSASGEFLAQAYFHPDHSLAGRVLSFDREKIEKVLKQRLHQAFASKKSFFDIQETNAFRLINAEADGIPGLIVDVYDDILVIQVGTWGIERLKHTLVSLLLELFHPRSIIEKSHSSSRQKEGLPPAEGMLYGAPLQEVQMMENGVKFLVPIQQGQKTGFFLDQREMRAQVQRYAKGKKVLNCFSYTGGFSLFALKGGASHVVSVDRCPKASELALRNTQLNGLNVTQHEIVTADVFDYLKKERREREFPFQLVILDPPAFAKKQGDLDQACKGYKEINRLVLEKMPPQSLLLTCSCSYYLKEKLFQTLLFQAALEAKREVKIIGSHLLAVDHPISIYHPESDYLKSFFLLVE